MILIQAVNIPGPNLTRTRPVHRLRAALFVLFPNGLQRSDLGLLGKKSDGSSAVPEHPQSQVRITQSSVLRMKPLRANVSARIVGIHQPAVKSNCSTGSESTRWRPDESVTLQVLRRPIPSRLVK